MSLYRLPLASALFLSLTGLAGSQPALNPPSSQEPPVESAEPAADAPASEAPEAEAPPELEFRGYFGTSYSVQFDRPASGKSTLRGYDFDDRAFKIDIIEADIRYALDRKGETGFRLDLTGGGSMPRVDAALGLFKDPYTGVSTTTFDIRQAFLRHTFHNGLQVDVGKFATHFGYEVMPGVDGVNPHGSVSASYTYSPFTHTGMRLSYPIDDKLSVQALAVLGADNFQDTNRSPSFGGQVHYHPTSDFYIAVNYLDGPEMTNNDSDRRRLLDFVTQYKINDTLSLGVHALTGSERGAGTWNSQVFYAQTRWSDLFSLNFRQEFFNDPLGLRTGIPVNLSSFTVTPEFHLSQDWLVRLDFSFDRAPQRVFESGTRLSGHQNSVMFSQSLRF